MADRNFSIFSNAEPKRDSYGFAVRPQHLQRYREYGHIYKEEEEERSEKWRSFLEQCALPADRCTSAGEHSKKSEDEERSEQKTEAVPEKFVEGDDSSRKSSISEGSTESRVGKEASVLRETKPRKIQTSWTPIRPSLALIEQMMSMRVKKKVSMKVDLIPPLQEHLPPIGEEISPGRSSEENFEDPLLNDEDSEGSPEVNVVDDSCRSAHTSNDSRQKNELLGISDQVAATNLSPKDAVLDSSCPENCKAYDDENGPNDFKERSTWKNIVTPERFFPVKEELESLVRGGVPKCIRGEVWQAFVGARARRVERYYQKLLSLEMDADNGKGVSGSGISGSSAETPEKWRKQIEKDLPRTFPGHPALDEEGRNSLRRILVAYARHNPSVGYCQAMNFFAGLLLLLMPEENAFWTLVGIIDDYFDGYYTQEMIESQVDQLVFEDLMRERFPKLVNHLDYLGVEVAWISGPWFLSIFVNMLPWESVLRVWDVIMFEGNRVILFRTALALMEIYGPAMVTTRDAGDAATLLQSLAGSTFDSSQLVLAACMGFLAVTEDRLEELRNKHRPAVLGIIEERTKGTEVSKESKSLATKLYSFKQDSQSLIKVADTNGGVPTQPKSSPDNFDDFMSDLNMYSEVDSLPDLQDQVVWYKVELCRLVEEKRLATLRAEELETAFLEMVKQDNRRQLAARVEQLEHEVAQLRQVLSDKEEQEKAMLQVLMRMEQEQKLTEEARIAAEQDAAAQRQAVHVLREKYEKAMTSVSEKEKRAVMAESMLEATIHYQSGQAKALSSPRALPSPQAGRKTGLLSFGLGWRDWNKGRSANVDDSAESRSLGKTNREQHQVRHSNTEDPAERNNSHEGTNSHHEQVN